MKKSCRFFLAAAAMAAAVVSRAADGAGEFDRASAEGAAELVLRELASEVLAGGKSEEALRSRMLSDPGAYRRRDAAAKSLERAYVKDLETRYGVEARKVMERLARPKKLEDAFSPAFMKEAGALKAEDTARSLAERYGGVFDAARKAACAEQAGKLQASVRPQEAEVDSLPEDRLREMLAARIAENQDTPVFEENVAFISERLAGPLIEEALKQRKAQQDSVRRTHADGFAPRVLEANLARHVRIFVAEKRQNAANGEWVYGVFPSVTNELVRKQARKIALSRAVDAVAEAKLGEDVEQLIEKAILDERAKHEKRDESMRVFEPMFVSELRDAAMKDVCARAPASERDEFSEFMSGQLERGDFADKVRGRVQEEFLPIVGRVRDALSRRQFAESYASFADGTWFPDGNLADRVCGSPAYRQEVARWRELPGTEGARAGAEGQILLAETQKLADDFAAGAFERARGARTCQLGLVEPNAKKVGERLAAEAKRGEKLTLQDVVDALTEAVRDDWLPRQGDVVWNGVTAENRPTNAKEHHAELFPSVLKKIEDAAKKILESVTEPEEKPPEEKPPEETPPPEEEKKEIECEVRFERSGDKVVIALVEDGKRFGSVSFSDSRSGYRKNLEQAADQIRQTMNSRLQRIAGMEGTKVTVTISVVDDYLYFGTVSETISALRTSADSCQIGAFSTVSPLGGQ